MAFKKINLTDEHLKLIENIKFEKFVFDLETRNGRIGWGIDQYSLFGGSYAMEDIALILGKWGDYIKGTENDPLGRRYPEELENHMWDLYNYIWNNMEYIIKLVLYYSNKGGLIPGEYKYNTVEETWSLMKENEKTNKEKKNEIKNKHEYVDLGLPSGKLWATDVIRNSNNEPMYFACGETVGYSRGQVGTDKVGTDKSFTWDDYELINELSGGETFSKYNENDGKTVLEPSDDAAVANWGNGWRMPTKEEFEELTANTTAEETEIEGVVGYLFTSTAEGYTDKSVFLPYFGYAGGGVVSDFGGYGGFWSSSLNSENVGNAWSLNFGPKGVAMYYGGRCIGYCVLPIKNRELYT